MKAPSLPHPRLACRLARFATALRGNPTDAAATGMSARHVAGCVDCQRYLAATAELDRQLVRQAHLTPPPVPADLEARIWQAVQPVVVRSRERARSRPWIAYTLAGAAAAVVLGVMQWRQPDPVEAPQLAEGATLTPEVTPAEALAAVEDWSARLWTAVTPGTTRLAQENPLQRELAAVQSDTRAALRFISRNFLPTQEGDAAHGTVDPASSS